MPGIKILYIITKLELGGAQKQLLSLIGSLDKERFEAYLFTSQDGLLLQDALRIKGLNIHRSRSLDGPINPWKDLFALIEIYFFIKRKDIRLVHTHSSKAGVLGRLAARLAGIKIIVHTVHGWSFNDYQHRLKRGLFIWLEKLCAEFSSRIIVVSEFDRNKGLENHIGSRDKYQLIRYGIDFKEFEKKDGLIRKELGLGGNDLLVVMVSCFKPQKSPLDFISLASSVRENLPGIKFLLAGDGPLRIPVEKSIRRMGLEGEVILAGWRRDIPGILSSADVFVLTSLWEGLPIAALEAMAASVPVVATDTGGIREVVLDGRTGYLAAPHDLENLSRKLVLILKDKDLRIRLARAAKASLNPDFKTENMARNTQSLYNGLARVNPD